jgi:hypothetical protein
MEAGSNNPQVLRTISREVLSCPAPQPVTMTPQRLHADAFGPVSLRDGRAYLQGALHDGTRSNIHRTHRFSQKGIDWLNRLQVILEQLGHKAWIYQEGKQRDVFILETSAPFLDIDYDPDLLDSESEAVAYVRGYFDAEGGIPQSASARFYVQFTQKDCVELTKVKLILEGLGIACGKIHNPSVNIDPDYWRFYVRAKSYRSFSNLIGSWHPRKERILQRMMI